MWRTNEGANAYEHSLDHNVEFFSKAGSLFTKRQSYYGNEDSALKLFQMSWIADKEVSFKLLLWLRDCRGGAGNRSAARECLRWLAENEPDWISCNMGLIPEVGRWDDLRTLFGTSLQDQAGLLWAEAIRTGNKLAAKWADRKDVPIRRALEMQNEAQLRKFLANARKDHIVEHRMCTKNWNEIEYQKVPSVAMARYTKAFGKNDKERFEKFKESLKKGEVKIHAGTLFPHDCVRTSWHGDKEIADAQFNELPDYIGDSGERILVISDTSGSMGVRVSGSVSAMDISQGMALYCSARMPKDSPFYKLFLGFSHEGRFKNWRKMKFSQAVSNRQIFDGAIGSTHIDRALDLILRTALERDIPQELMPTTLLIVSDMQFHSGTATNDTEVEACLKKFDAEGYERPKVVYWNTAGYGGQQDTVNANNIGFVSGFSPGILKAVFGGEDFTPRAIMLRALEKYEIVSPFFR